MDGAAKLRIKTAEAGARARLIDEVGKFVDGFADESFLLELGRNPSSNDIMPHFEAYASMIFDAEARKWLASIHDDEAALRRYRRILEGLIKRITKGISRRGGVWQQTVEASCRNFLCWFSPYGSFTPRVLVRGHWMNPVTRLLRRRVEHWIYQGWAKLASDAESRLVLGRNLDRLREECGWSLERLSEQTEIKKDSIIDHKNGRGAHPDTLRKYASAFTRELNRQVTVAELLRVPVESSNLRGESLKPNR